jgi:hypothetical protein
LVSGVLFLFSDGPRHLDDEHGALRWQSMGVDDSSFSAKQSLMGFYS